MKLIGYINERGDPVIKTLTPSDLEYCLLAGMQFLYSKPAREAHRPEVPSTMITLIKPGATMTEVAYELLVTNRESRELYAVLAKHIPNGDHMRRDFVNEVGQTVRIDMQAYEPAWIDDPHDIEQGMMRNPKFRPSAAAKWDCPSGNVSHMFGDKK